MSKIKSQRKGCKDVFDAFLVASADYSGIFEFPNINPCYEIPNNLIAFSKAVSCKNYDQWVHFYEEDYQFERIWRNPKRYLTIFQKYRGVILPDFSIFRDMPLAMQLWNIYRSRAIGSWLQRNGIKVIANVRYGDQRTYHCACDGVAEHCVIAVGTHGTIQSKEDRYFFVAGLEVVVKVVQPTAIVVYGRAPDDIFLKYKTAGIEIIQFDSECDISHKEVI